MAVAGRLFEKKVLQVLQRVRFQLVQLGGANDGGVDLRGVWALPDNTSIPVIAQCKFTNTACKPAVLRELEGTLLRERAGTLGLIVCAAGCVRALSKVESMFTDAC
eukprot:m.43558 g.43558  ORF g.43558 m.43558 type:complete len:106 (-) comp10793_c0_seq2:656-973(-)